MSQQKLNKLPSLRIIKRHVFGSPIQTNWIIWRSVVPPPPLLCPMYSLGTCLNEPCLIFLLVVGGGDHTHARMTGVSSLANGSRTYQTRWRWRWSWRRRWLWAAIATINAFPLPFVSLNLSFFLNVEDALVWLKNRATSCFEWKVQFYVPSCGWGKKKMHFTPWKNVCKSWALDANWYRLFVLALSVLLSQKSVKISWCAKRTALTRKVDTSDSSSCN